MDRLLKWLLKHFVHRGTLRFTTARGSVFTVGDGADPQVAIHFMTKAAQRGVLLDPEIKLGEAYMDGTLRVEEGSIADLLGIVLGQSKDGMPPIWAQSQWLLATCGEGSSSSTGPSARKAMSRTIMISTDGFTRCSSIQTSNIPAAISRAPGNLSTTPNSPRSGISPPSCCRARTVVPSTSAAAGAALRSISPSSAGPR